MDRAPTKQLTLPFPCFHFPTITFHCSLSLIYNHFSYFPSFRLTSPTFRTLITPPFLQFPSPYYPQFSSPNFLYHAFTISPHFIYFSTIPLFPLPIFLLLPPIISLYTLPLISPHFSASPSLIPSHFPSLILLGKKVLQNTKN